MDAELCPRCECCSTDWEPCWNCGGDIYVEHDCFDDTCCCLYPEDNVVCDICDGAGGWMMCLGGCDSEGRHDERSRAALDSIAE